MKWRSTVVVAGLAAVLAGTALAAAGDPQKKYTKADQARARAASLRLSDFASGWKAKPGSKNGSHPRCSKYNPDQSDLVQTGKYDSPDFARADGSSVSVSTSLFRTVKMARTGYSRVARPALPACFGELFTKGVTRPNSAQVTFAGRLSFPKVGDRSNAYRLRAVVKTPSGSAPVGIDLVLFNKGRYDIALIFLGIGKPLPSSLEQAAVARVVSRVR